MNFKIKFTAKGFIHFFEYEIINKSLICTVYKEGTKICMFPADSLKKAMQKLKDKIYFSNEKIDINFLKES